MTIARRVTRPSRDETKPTLRQSHMPPVPYSTPEPASPAKAFLDLRFFHATECWTTVPIFIAKLHVVRMLTDE